MPTSQEKTIKKLDVMIGICYRPCQYYCPACYSSKLELNPPENYIEGAGHFVKGRCLECGQTFVQHFCYTYTEYETKK